MIINFEVEIEGVLLNGSFELSSSDGKKFERFSLSKKENVIKEAVKENIKVNSFNCIEMQ
ncbi:hypothetical protein SAMN02745163_02072 [Clostridium cavendishii DSM 21758]|uniref:Uncharacterized protein n=1 Tax=Clostridium cavendishii DSM 21758 TaxID=1121302 RepID=A0A1M6K1C9_9CLOT|nr:hypothetical protein [Clostridium cavendishii]SHJ52759.1 hypothetical protein SAMN02745163_02072 [Clostridium cavendishii DSM 21758]